LQNKPIKTEPQQRKVDPQKSIFEIVKQIDGMQADLNVKIDALATVEKTDRKSAAKKIFKTIKEKNATLEEDCLADEELEELAAADDAAFCPISVEVGVSGQHESKRLRKSTKK
jgi:methionyl-tRNA synthetase